MFSSIIIIILSLIGLISAMGGDPKRKYFVEIGNFNKCEGKDATNYTYIGYYSLDQICTPGTNAGSAVGYLTASPTNGQKMVNVIKVLASSVYPAGGMSFKSETLSNKVFLAYYQAEILCLASGGNLSGKYVYIKEVGLTEAYLKRCSSVLGYSYVSTKSQVLLISDKLDMNIFMNPSGAYEPFKRTTSTICQGRSIII